MKTKHFLVTILFIFCSFALFSQVVTTDPEFPSAEDSVIVYYDASLGNQALMNYTGDIYAHTGLITDSSENTSDWEFVIASWSENLEKAKLTKVSDNLYKLKIAPSIKEYYEVTDERGIQKLAFVFRNEDGSKVGREANGDDIFADVYPPGLNLNIISPVNNLIITPGDQVGVIASSNDADSMFLYIDENLIYEIDSSNMHYLHTENIAGLHQIKITAKNADDEFAEDTVSYYVRGNITIEDVPSGWHKGINYLADDSVGLVLFAPNKEFVFYIGDITNWQLDDDYLMNKSSDGEYYWIGLGSLTPQKEYIFQYFIDGEIKIADPYTEKISDPNDQYIDEATYPGLIEYPDFETDHIASVMQTGQVEYQWQNTDYDLAPKENLIIYELLIRDFIAKHDYNTLIDTISYLDSLGVNAIELMPFSEFEGNESWGYNPSFYFAPDKYYGPKNDLKEFIDTCHGRGIAVIMDMVLNHSYGQSPLVRMYFDPSAGDYGQPTADNPWYNETSPNSSYSWGFDFNHESNYTKEFVDSVNSYWLKHYKVDGFRFDFTKGFTNTSGDGWNYDASRIAILKRMADKIWEVNDTAFVILEHFTDNSEEIELSTYGMLIWGNLNHAYMESAKGNSSDILWASYRERGWNYPNLVTYMESHDEERLTYACLNAGSSNSSYNIRNKTTALKRMELAANFFIPIPGPKMIWQFGELGYDISIDDDCRVCNKPILWEYTTDSRRLRIYKIYQTLNNLKQEYDVFSTSSFTINDDGTAKSINLNSDDLNVVIIGNFDITTLYVNTTFPHTGMWYELYTGDSISVTYSSEMISLSAGEYRFYTDKKIIDPIFPVTVGINDYPNELKHEVFPNPSSDVFYFNFDETILQGKLYIYDLQGKLIFAQDINSSSKVEFNSISHPKGIYFYKIITDDGISSGKLIKE